ncbi:hypothetical protein Y032_0041g357 [Ancylostoma ceylanicum]|uniref:Uncharacterized protein n=1 Tax=Ancylostoma ceylanicum TaxID=53326 RepID=A0A016UG47_9BILA|nr:hypothetical protein Y032_0041g357 [Ancylostoma ceylanicum]
MRRVIEKDDTVRGTEYGEDEKCRGPKGPRKWSAALDGGSDSKISLSTTAQRHILPATTPSCREIDGYFKVPLIQKIFLTAQLGIES